MSQTALDVSSSLIGSSSSSIPTGGGVSSNTSKKTPIGAIVGGVIGGLVAIAAFSAFLFIFLKKRKGGVERGQDIDDDDVYGTDDKGGERIGDIGDLDNRAGEYGPYDAGSMAAIRPASRSDVETPSSVTVQQQQNERSQGPRQPLYLGQALPSDRTPSSDGPPEVLYGIQQTSDSGYTPSPSGRVPRGHDPSEIIYGVQQTAGTI